MNYLASNAITGILRDCFDIHFHIHLLMMQLPRQQSLSWRLNHRACSRGGIMRTCAILYFFFPPSRHRSHDLQLQDLHLQASIQFSSK